MFLDRSAKWLLTINASFAVSVALSSTFVNVYLWKVKSDYTMIGLFNLFQYLMIAMTFVLAGWLVKRRDRVVTLRIGVVVLALFYLSVLLLGKRSVDHVLWLGALLGVGNGFYWLGYNVLYFEITEPDNRDRYNGADGLFTSLSEIIAPLLSGWLIMTLSDLWGYYVIFGISLGIFLLAIFMTFFLPKRPLKGRYALCAVYRQSRQKTKWHYAMLASIGQGLPDAVFVFLIGLLVYVVTGSEWKLGLFFFVTAGVSLVAYFLVGRFIRRSWRNAFILLGALMMSIAVIPSLFQTHFWTIILFGIGLSLFAPFFLIPLTSTVFDLIGANRWRVKTRVEHVVMRELALSVGRLLGIVAFLVWVQLTQKTGHLLLLIFILSLLQCFSWFFMKKADGVQDR
ncbi:MAG: hypothetical protein BAA01_07180 [Bacillus thermozeamaize]|jgi:YQGE family putative transporter|uniref:Major facilitator superfamily (MFS) profile domain-containing protein n=1 Tax=Bacillus thermozeamaize TaxID=230954 RepID=A0A1Y3PUP6_9BACI|nr:MAG: hypothetical protein BAA01_07180 [Bacillus thermozeamaize]